MFRVAGSSQGSHNFTDNGDRPV